MRNKAVFFHVNIFFLSNDPLFRHFLLKSCRSETINVIEILSFKSGLKIDHFFPESARCFFSKFGKLEVWQLSYLRP